MTDGQKKTIYHLGHSNTQIHITYRYTHTHIVLELVTLGF